MNYDILSIKEKFDTLISEAGKISGRKKSHIERHGSRRFENGKLYQTSRLGEASVERLIADTKEWGGPGIAHEYGFAPANKESRTGFTLTNSPMEAYEAALAELNRLLPEFIFSGKCTVQDTSTTLQSSYGLDLATSGENCEWYFICQRKGSGNMMDGYFGESTSRPNFKKIIDENVPFLKAQLREVKLSSGRMPVLLVEEMTPLEKLIDSFPINSYNEGTSLFSGKLGQKLFDPRISFIDSAYDPANGHLRFFDGEGIVRNEDLKLIDQGQFKTLIADLRFGKKFNSSSTGNGLRAYNRGVSLSPRSLRLAPGQKTWQEIVKGLDRCLVALVAAGGDTNDLGEFSSPVQIGYVLENGEIIGRAPQLTIRNSLTNYLGKDLIDVSSTSFYGSSPSACLVSEMDIFVS